METIAQAVPEAGSPLALRLTESRVLTTKLRRIDREGALVTSLPHPPVVQAGKQLDLAWHDGARWQMIPVAVLQCRVAPNRDAGYLRLGPIADDDGDANHDDGGDAGDPADSTISDAVSDGSRPLAKAGDVPAVGAGVALRLASGRVLSTKVASLDSFAIVLALPQPSALAEGTALEVAWSVGPKWYSLASAVGPAGADGLLRLLPARVSSEEKNRRSEARYSLALGLRIRVEKGRTLRPGTDLRAKTEDVSLGGISFTVEADLYAGDVLKLTLLGGDGQIGADTLGRIVRAGRRPGAIGTSVGVAFHDPPGTLTSALRRMIWSQG